MVTREHLPRATAIGQTASSMGMLAGPALAGLLVGQFGARTPLLIDAASYLAIGLAGPLLKTRRRAGHAVAQTQGVPEPAGWRLTAFGYLAGGVLLSYASPRSLIAASAVAGLLVVAGFAAPIGRAVRRERAMPTISDTALDTDRSDTVAAVG